MSLVVMSETLAAGATGQIFRPAGGITHNVFIESASGPLVAERSFDGLSFYPVAADATGTASTWSAPTSFTFVEPEDGVVWRFRSVSGGAVYRVSR
jgi:hypothetical protein